MIGASPSRDKWVQSDSAAGMRMRQLGPNRSSTALAHTSLCSYVEHGMAAIESVGILMALLSKSPMIGDIRMNSSLTNHDKFGSSIVGSLIMMLTLPAYLCCVHVTTCRACIAQRSVKAVLFGSIDPRVVAVVVVVAVGNAKPDKPSSPNVIQPKSLVGLAQAGTSDKPPQGPNTPPPGNTARSASPSRAESYVVASPPSG